MKKMIKNAFTLCFVFLIGISSFNYAYAETPQIQSGVIHEDSSKYDLYINSLSESELNKIRKKSSRIQAIEEQLIKEESMTKHSIKKAASTKIDIPGTFTMYHQSESNYCVPACVKSVLHYLNGSSSSQFTIALALGTISSGTDITKVPKYLNKKQDTCIYLFKSSPSKATLCSFIYSTIAYDHAPCIMGIIDTSGNTWGYYSTNGHALVVNAIYSDKNRIQFADPAGGSDGIPVYYSKTAYIAHKACAEIIY